MVRLVSLYPHRFVHCVGDHQMNGVECVAVSGDRAYVASFASGNTREDMRFNQTNRPQSGNGQPKGEVIKIWRMAWSPQSTITKGLKETERKRRRMAKVRNLKNLARGVQSFLELDRDDFDLKAMERAAKERRERVKALRKEQKARHKKEM